MKKIQNISGIIYIVLGLFMVLKPVSVSNVICYIIGGVIAVFGTSFLINYFKTPDSAGGKAILVISLIMIKIGRAHV